MPPVAVEPRLTKRALEIADLVGLGLTNREIAAKLFRSERTVEWHVEQIMNKLGFSSRSQIAAWVARKQAGAARRVQGNLPSQITSFVGREAELRTLLDLISSNRLVTVTGPGGSGKTRLVLRLGEELQPDFDHGVWLCDLAPVTDPANVGDAIAHALNVKPSITGRLTGAREHLKDKTALLVFDNCEHVVEAAAVAAQDLLAACPGIRIVATSRIPLGVIGEALNRLDPLSPDEAVQLFKERAEASVPGFRLTPENNGEVATICRRLDGVPLAIELVVPRLRVQNAKELASTVLDQKWEIEGRDRHRSVSAIAAWSYGLLVPAEQELFRRLGVFAGWFDSADAETLSSAGASTPVLLGSLVEKSMVTIQQSAVGRRYRLLDLIKAFARRQLRETGEFDQVARMHADYVVGVIEAVDVLRGPGRATPREKAFAMVDDVRAALQTLLTADPERAVWLNACMGTSWTAGGRTEEGLAWSETTLAASLQPSRARCWGLMKQAVLLAEAGRRDEARSRLHEAEAIADGPGAEELHHETLVQRVYCYDAIGDPDAAQELRDEAIREFERRGEDEKVIITLNHSAMMLLYAGRPVEAKPLAMRAVELRRKSRRGRLPGLLDTLAQAHVMCGEVEAARRCWLEGLEPAIGTTWELAGVLYGLALVIGMAGNGEVALRFHFAGEQILADINASTYADPVAPLESELIARLESELGQEVVERLRTESATLTPESLLALARS